MKKSIALLGMLALITFQTAFAQSSRWLTENPSPKYTTEPALYTSAYNPASLGFIDHDTFFFWMVTPLPPPAVVDTHGRAQLLGGYYVKEENGLHKIGYMMPLGERVGLGIEHISTRFHRGLNTPFWFNDPEGTPVQELGANQDTDGGIVSLGYRFREDMSVGASAAVWYMDEREFVWDYMYEEGLGFSVLGAYMLQIPDRDLALSFSAAYAYVKQRYLDIAAQKLKEGAPPLVLEATMASSLLDGRLYLNAAVITDIYVDGRGAHVIRAIPVAEYALALFFSVRAGGELSYMLQAGDFALGYGGFAGVSFKFWRIELNGNFTMRLKPARMLPGYSLQDMALLVGMRVTPGFLER
jgi:hypothetical protein